MPKVKKKRTGDGAATAGRLEADRELGALLLGARLVHARPQRRQLDISKLDLGGQTVGRSGQSVRANAQAGRTHVTTHLNAHFYLFVYLPP